MLFRRTIAAQGAVFIAAGLLLAGCDQSGQQAKPAAPTQQDQVGTVNVAVTLVAPWEDYADSLAPGFRPLGEEALKQVVRRSAILEERGRSSLSGKAGVQLSLAGGASEGEKKPPEAGREGGGGSNKPAGAAEKTEEVKPEAVANPMLLYAAATALHQEVQLLNRYVHNAAFRREVKPYIVRLQINVVPYARDKAYDAYSYISFFAETRDRDKPFGDPASITRVEVIPLLVTDSLEGALLSQSLESSRQLALAARLSAPRGIGADAGLSQIKDELRDAQGADLNSLLTVGRLSENTIQVRLGAARRGSNFFMVPQNHNVTLVIAVPSNFAAQPLGVPGIRVVTKTVLRDSATGTLLGSASIDDRIKAADAALTAHFGGKVQITKGFCPRPEDDGNCDAPQRQLNAADRLLQHVYNNDFSSFAAVLKTLYDPNPAAFPRDLWMEIVHTLGRSGYSRTHFELPVDLTEALPEEQPLLAVDDGVASMKIAMVGGYSLIGDAMTAMLEVTTADNKKLIIPATKVETQAGRNPSLTFPSLSAIKGQQLDAATGTFAEGAVILRYRKRDLRSSNVYDLGPKRFGPVLVVKGPSPETKAQAQAR